VKARGNGPAKVAELDRVGLLEQQAPSSPAPAIARPRQPKTHRLKSWPDNFRAVLTGRKRFEIRRDDRDIQPGDRVLLDEFEPFDVEGGQVGPPRGYTGRQALYFVGYVERSPAIPAGWCGFDLISPEDLNRVELAIGGGR
jgi:hypothetical protein